MTIEATDLIVVRTAEGSADERPRKGASQLLAAGRAALRPLSDLETALGLPTGNVIASGVSALAITDTTNVAASVAGDARFQRIGNTVFVSGSCTIDPTAGAPTTTAINIALPVASTLGAATDLSGTIVGGTDGVDVGTIVGDAGSDDALATWEANHTDVQTYTYQFSYEVI